MSVSYKSYETLEKVCHPMEGQNHSILVDPGQRVQQTHKRSVSYGGVVFQKNSVLDVKEEISLKEEGVPCHQRAHSHGGITTEHKRNHCHHSSKTDFQLPADHIDRPKWKLYQNSSYGHYRQPSRTESVYTIRDNRRTFYQKLKFWKRAKDESCRRIIVPNHKVPPFSMNHPNACYPSNKICTTRYSVLTFLPKNLFEQFHRFANLYFLFILLLNFVPAINAFAKEIAIIPLGFVLGITAIKDCFEDRRRYNSDKRVNNKTCRVYSGTEERYVKKKWQDVCVGDIIHLSCNEVIPADLVLLNSSDESGTCFIETSNLDGESNLKQRHRAPLNIDNFSPSKFDFIIEVGQPSTKIYHFLGFIPVSSGKHISLTKDNILLRDCLIKNTDYVEGIVVYAGKETKVFLNNDGTRHKRSKLERHMNGEILWCVIILVVICLFSSTGSSIWQSHYAMNTSNGAAPFVSHWNGVHERQMSMQNSRPGDISYSAVWTAFLSFWTFVIVYQVIIPISLYVSVELMKLLQLYHIHADEDFRDDSGKTIECRALNIPEELGQVQYVFSDKTGTLTENKMVFHSCSIGGFDYAHQLLATNSSQDNPLQRDSFLLNPLLRNRISSLAAPSKANWFFSNEENAVLTDFFLTLALCNTVVVSKSPHQDQMNSSGLVLDNKSMDASTKLKRKAKNLLKRGGFNLADMTECSPDASAVEAVNFSADTTCEFYPDMESLNNDRLRVPSDVQDSLVNRYTPFYEAESPDEMALIDAAYKYKFRLLRRQTNAVVLSMPDNSLVEFETLHVLPFDSVRKRMSVLLQNPLTGEKVLYCKGADSSIINNLKYPVEETRKFEIFRAQQHISNYAKKGLRILCMAKRIISDSEYNEWLELLTEAENMIAGRELKLRKAYERIEMNLTFLGVTGIEDKLQDEVPETILSLRNAGIVVWVLTGDKQETAENIAYSCSLFSSDMEILPLTTSTKDETEITLLRYLRQLDEDNWLSSSHGTSAYFDSSSSQVSLESHCQPPKCKGLVVSGKTLTYILDWRTNLKDKFMALAQQCSAVLCCRTTPLQKALVVKSIKENLSMLTLAIGDGANDVSMIQTADIGIGISGMEGRQAAMASDYAITRFKHLNKLLLVHGHWCYDRLARMILYFFYKNSVLVFTLMWYQFYNGFSASVMIDQLNLITFNLLFTAIPPIVVGIYDKDASEDILLENPHLYAVGRDSQLYRKHSFWTNIIDALYQSIIIFFFTYIPLEDSGAGIYEFGFIVLHALVLSQLLHLFIEMKSWNMLCISSMLFSYALFYAFNALYMIGCVACFSFVSQYGEFTNAMTSTVHWLCILLCSCVAVLPRFMVKCFEFCLFPSEVQQALIQRKVKSVFNIA